MLFVKACSTTGYCGPISPFYQVLSSEFAGKFVYLIFTVPLTILLGIILKPAFDVFLPAGFLFSVVIVSGLGAAIFVGLLAGTFGFLVYPRGCITGITGFFGVSFFQG